MFGSELLDHCVHCQNFVTAAVCQPCSEDFKKNKVGTSLEPISFIEDHKSTMIPQLVLLDTILSGCEEEPDEEEE